jgi:hypothetical protein
MSERQNSKGGELRTRVCRHAWACAGKTCIMPSSCVYCSASFKRCFIAHTRFLKPAPGRASGPQGPGRWWREGPHPRRCRQPRVVS